MKRRIVFALISVLICVGAAVWLVPYTPMPDMDGMGVRIWRVNGADMTELTEQVDQTALREALTQVQAKRVPRSQSSFSMDKVSYEIIAVYNDTPTFLNIGELNFVYNGNGWVHDLKNGSEILTQLDEICNN